MGNQRNKFLPKIEKARLYEEHIIAREEVVAIKVARYYMQP
jgi:hypothetical protein